MHLYRCYFLNDENRIKDFENIEADVRDDAVRRALAMLTQRPQHRGIEIWQRANRVYTSPMAVARA